MRSVNSHHISVILGCRNTLYTRREFNTGCLNYSPSVRSSVTDSEHRFSVRFPIIGIRLRPLSSNSRASGVELLGSDSRTRARSRLVGDFDSLQTLLVVLTEHRCSRPISCRHRTSYTIYDRKAASVPMWLVDFIQCYEVCCHESV